MSWMFWMLYCNRLLWRSTPAVWDVFRSVWLQILSWYWMGFLWRPHYHSIIHYHLKSVRYSTAPFRHIDSVNCIWPLSEMTSHINGRQIVGGLPIFLLWRNQAVVRFCRVVMKEYRTLSRYSGRIIQYIEYSCFMLVEWEEDGFQ